MKLHTKIQLLKFCSTLLNFIFLALGLSVAGCGLWILFDRGFISVASKSSDVLQVVAVTLLAVGGLVLVVCVLGCVGAQRESHVLLLPVGVVLVLLVLAQIFITLLLLITEDEISTQTKNDVDKRIQQYSPYSPEEPLLLDNLQHYAKCCGLTGPSDWQKNKYLQSLNLSEVLPCSCFKGNRYESGAFCSDNLTVTSETIQYGNSSYSQGCDTALQEWMNENLWTIIGMNLGLLLVQVAQLVVLVNLYRSFRAKSSVKSCEPDQDQDQVYSDQEQLNQDLDQELHHEAYDGPYGEPYEGQYQDPDQDYS